MCMAYICYTHGVLDSKINNKQACIFSPASLILWLHQLEPQAQYKLCLQNLQLTAYRTTCTLKFPGFPLPKSSKSGTLKNPSANEEQKSHS